MAETLTPEKWGNKESAGWWSAGQASRQESLGAATEMMLDLAGVQAGSRVLDVAAGTGESTIMAAHRVGPTGYVLATDNSSSMLSIAGEAAQKENLTNIETGVMNAENLELEADSFDAVICRNALMHFPNPIKALTEMCRVVKPRGKIALWCIPRWKKILTTEYRSALFVAWAIYPRQRRMNTRCTHWEIQGGLKRSTTKLSFRM
jgi:ubiquinone/menaquinone biosynthesis C-methylase UbiE